MFSEQLCFNFVLSPHKNHKLHHLVLVFTSSNKIISFLNKLQLWSSQFTKFTKSHNITQSQGLDPGSLISTAAPSSTFRTLFTGGGQKPLSSLLPADRLSLGTACCFLFPGLDSRRISFSKSLSTWKWIVLKIWVIHLRTVKLVVVGIFQSRNLVKYFAYIIVLVL